MKTSKKDEKKRKKEEEKGNDDDDDIGNEPEFAVSVGIVRLPSRPSVRGRETDNGTLGMFLKKEHSSSSKRMFQAGSVLLDNCDVFMALNHKAPSHAFILFLSLSTPLDPACFTSYSASQDNSHSRHNSLVTGGRDESEDDDVSSDEEGDGSEKDRADSDDSDDSDDDTQRAKRALAEVPFGVLQVRPAAAISSQQIRISTGVMLMLADQITQELQKDGTHGKQERSAAKDSKANLVGKAAHKGAPVEMGSKKPVSRFRVVS